MNDERKHRKPLAMLISNPSTAIRQPPSTNRHEIQSFIAIFTYVGFLAGNYVLSQMLTISFLADRYALWRPVAGYHANGTHGP